MVNYCFTIRMRRHDLLRKSFICCGSETREQQGKSRFKCNKCKNTASLKSGSFLQGTRLDLGQWLAMAFLFFSTNSSICGVSSDLNLNIKTVLQWIKKSSFVCVDQNRADFLESKLKCLSSDETHFGLSKYFKGRRQRQKCLCYLVTCGLDRPEHPQKVLKVFATPVPSKTAENLLQHVKQLGEPNCVFLTDQHASYKAIKHDRPDIDHRTVNHKREFKSASGTTTNSIESCNSRIKRLIRLAVFYL